jgi:AraC-like DNA-binding protein
MAIIAALLDNRSAITVLRRTTPRASGSVRSCRTVTGFHRLLESELIDSIVLGVRAAQLVPVAGLKARFPIIPIVVYGSFRPDHAGLIAELHGQGVAALLVDGVDDPIVGDVVARNGYLARRRADLAELPRRLRLTEGVQKQTLDRLLGRVGGRWTATALARSVGLSREHLSRQFAAAGSPNLKRVIDLVQVLAARDLIANPGYPIVRVAHLLGFANPSHLRSVIRRVVRLSLEDFRRATPADLQRRFATRGSRSRA